MNSCLGAEDELLISAWLAWWSVDHCKLSNKRSVFRSFRNIKTHWCKIIKHFDEGTWKREKDPRREIFRHSFSSLTPGRFLSSLIFQISFLPAWVFPLLVVQKLLELDISNLHLQVPSSAHSHPFCLLLPQLQESKFCIAIKFQCEKETTVL